MTSARRMFCTVFLLSIALGSFAASAHGDPGATRGPCGTYYGSLACESHGDRYRNLGGSDNGTRAYIAGGGSSFPVGEIVAYVAIQDAKDAAEDTIDGYAGMVDIGELERSGAWQDVCGSGPAVLAYSTYRVSNQTTWHCPYTKDIGQFGSGGLFDVEYQSGVGWHARRNGIDVYPPVTGLGFTSGWSVAADVEFIARGYSPPTEAITFGPSCCNKWQFTTNNGSTYQDVQTSDRDQNNDTDPTADSDGDWNLQGTPSPFNINWTGY